MQYLKPVLNLVFVAVLMNSAACGHEQPVGDGATTLANADTIGGLTCSLNGFVGGDSTGMFLQVRNETERTWVIDVEVGTKLEPENGNVQRMVVTEEIHVTIEPHDRQEITLEVACLDISLPPPSDTDNEWSLSPSPKLAEFLRCVEASVDAVIGTDIDPEERASFIQAALWHARGASREQWIELLIDYHDMTYEEASEAVDADKPLWDDLIADCPLLYDV